MHTTGGFHPTRWTLVVRASGTGEEAKSALSDLCEAYYAPVVSFLRREGRNDDEARETAHEFFARLLESGVGGPEPGHGRFRSFLLGALKNFLSKRRDAAMSQKRGAGAEHVPFVAETDTSPGLQIPAAPGPAPELLFDREWAATLIARALQALEIEHSERAAHFTTLKPWLKGAGNHSQAEAARQLGMSETAVKVAIHRLRVRFREMIRAEIAATVNDPAETEDELRHLIAIASTA